MGAAPVKACAMAIINEPQDGWEITALFSNTAKAHELDKTHDWVVIYYQRDGRGARTPSSPLRAASWPASGSFVVARRSAVSTTACKPPRYAQERADAPTGTANHRLL